MSRSSAKIDVTGILRAHYRTYVTADTGKQRWQDHALLSGVPVAIAVACGVGNVQLQPAASAGLLTVAGLLSAFLFGVMLQISQRSMDWADSAPLPSPETSAHAIYLGELAANSGYASLISIAAAAVFVVASVSSDWVLRISSVIGMGLAAHMALVLLMVMKRVFSLTQGRLNRVRTGADCRDARSRRAS